MTTEQKADFIKKRVRAMAFSVRRKPRSAASAYAYFELARIWATRNGNAELADAAREAKAHVLAVAA